MPQIPNRILSVKVTTDLSSEPVTTSDIKSYGNITYSDYDLLIAVLGRTARQMLEKSCGRSFGVKTIQCDLAHNGIKPIRLPNGEVDSISELFYKPCHLQPYNDRVSEVLDRRSNPTDDAKAFEIWNGDRLMGCEGYYMITYDTTDAYATDDVKTAIKAQAMFLFENRGDETKKGMICEVAKAIIQPLIPGDLLI